MSGDAAATSALPRRPRRLVGQPGRINLQMIRHYQICFSAALIACIEAHVEDDATRQDMTRPAPMTDTIEDFLGRKHVDDLNLAAWRTNERINQWIQESRLDFFSTMLAGVAPEDAEKMGTLGQIMAMAPLAAERLASLFPEQTSTATEGNS